VLFKGEISIEECISISYLIFLNDVSAHDTAVVFEGNVNILRNSAKSRIIF